MARLKKKRKTRKRLYNPELMTSGAENTGVPVYQCFIYNPGSCTELNNLHSADDLDEILTRPEKIWLNLHGLNNVELIRDIGQKLGLEKLLLIDLVNSDQRPYLEDTGDQLFFSFKIVRLQPDSGEFEIDQISFVLKQGLLVSFQEKPGHIFDEIRERLRHGKGQVRLRNTDYLLFLMMDAVLQTYQHTIDHQSDLLESIEQGVNKHFDSVQLQSLQDLRRDLIYLLKSIFPLREMLAKISTGSIQLIDESTLRYFRGLQNQILDTTENIMMYRDIINNIMELQLALQGMRLNEIIRILTVISTVFIPLTFIVGIYGMNFEWMPELTWWWAYPAILCFMLLISLGMLYYFKRRGWI